MGFAGIVQDLPEQLENSWTSAQAIVEHTLTVPTPFVTLIRNSWCGLVDPVDFVRLSGFTTISPACLIAAAGLTKGPNSINSQNLLQAIHYLGIRNAAVVLGINCGVRSVLKGQPGSWWKEMLENLAVDLCIGYRLGARVGELGTEGGMLTAFGQYIGLGILSAWDKSAFRIYRREQSTKELKNDDYIRIFGCEPYQVAASAMQSLGFGAEVGFGTALAVGQLDCSSSTFDRGLQRWPAAAQWLKALKEGRGYPANLGHRSFFTSIAPNADSSKRNPNLEVLYTEVARARQEAADLRWHLPRNSYEETKELLALS